MIKAGKMVAIVLLIVAAVIGGMKVVSKFCCKQNCDVVTECCQHASCDCGPVEEMEVEESEEAEDVQE